MKVVLVTGGFDPLHSGHLEYFEAARKLGDMLIVGLNSDEWLQRKKGRSFMHIYEREKIVSSLKVVDKVICYPDADGSSKNAITGVRAMYPDATIIFANGGDRTQDNIPEMDVSDDNIKFVFGVGGEDKKNSSSWILNEWKEPKTERQWGYWTVLKDVGSVKVKELVIKPGCSLSNQKHSYRNERWHIISGTLSLLTEHNNRFRIESFLPHDTALIEKNVWHRATNVGKDDCHIIEIQYGEKCIEEDIERK